MKKILNIIQKAFDVIDEYLTTAMFVLIAIYAVGYFVTKDAEFIDTMQYLFILIIVDTVLKVYKIVDGKFNGNLTCDKISVNINGTEVVSTEPKEQYVSGSPVPLVNKLYNSVPVRLRNSINHEWIEGVLVTVSTNSEYPFFAMTSVDNGFLYQFKYAEFI